MSKCKSSAGYDIIMARLSILRPEQWPQSFPFPDEKAAKSWRFSFYAFRAALQREKDSRYLNLAPVQVKVSGNMVTLDHMDNSEQSRIMQTILDGTLAGPTPQQKPLNPSTTNPDGRSQKDLTIATSSIGMDAVMEYLRGGRGEEKGAENISLSAPLTLDTSPHLR